MKLLELFCGTKSLSNVFKQYGHEVFTIDNNADLEPDLVADINNLNPNSIPFNPDVIWCSPPCQTFSVASISTHWTGGQKAYIPKTAECKVGIHLLTKCIEFINYKNPKYWFIENPRGVMRKIGVMPMLHKKTVTYCQYGDKRMKPTDIWTNCVDWIPRPMCKNGDSCHTSAPRGSRTGTQGLKDSIERGRIPKELCIEILRSCEK